MIRKRSCEKLDYFLLWFWTHIVSTDWSFVGHVSLALDKHSLLYCVILLFVVFFPFLTSLNDVKDREEGTGRWINSLPLTISARTHTQTCIIKCRIAANNAMRLVRIFKTMFNDQSRIILYVREIHYRINIHYCHYIIVRIERMYCYS